MSRYIDIEDANQGTTEHGRTFGFCGIDGRGGQFFTYFDRLDDTLASIEDDETDPPVDWPERAYQEVRGFVRRAWRRAQGTSLGHVDD